MDRDLYLIKITVRERIPIFFTVERQSGETQGQALQRATDIISSLWPLSEDDFPWGLDFWLAIPDKWNSAADKAAEWELLWRVEDFNI